MDGSGGQGSGGGGSDAGDAVAVRAQAALLGIDLPDACVASVAEALRGLAGHAALLRQALGTDPEHGG